MYDDVVVDHVHDAWAGWLDGRWRTDGTGVRRVLDLCCGTGLLTAALVRRGYDVVGVDASQAMLDRARDRLGPRAALLLQTLPALTVVGPFDAAVSSFDGLNYLGPADLRATFRHLGTVLRPGAWFAADLHTDAMRAFTIAHPVVRGRERGRTYTLRSDVDGRVCDTRIEMTGDDGDTLAETHRQYFHADATVRSALADAGFGTVQNWHEYTDSPPSADTLRATWTARRTSR